MVAADLLRPTVRDDQNEGEVYNTPVIGIIYPPPELRNIVDKTAAFVAKNGVDFEAKIRQKEAGNPKFNFLTHGDPYHAYYEHKVGEFMRGVAQEPQAPPRPQTPPQTSTNVVQDKLRKQLEVIVLKDPPTTYEFFADPPSISGFDLDVVKLTAQCVAKNGRDFLAELMDKESKNFQFDFLKPQHSLFDYFTKLVEQYAKILLPSKRIVQTLRDEANNPRKVLDAARYRAEWYRRDLREKERENEEQEKERIAYAQIDWHDFTVVETIDYQQWEEGEFPAPTTPEEVGARSLLYERMLQEQQQQQQRQQQRETSQTNEADDITVEMEIEDEEPAPAAVTREEFRAPAPPPIPVPSMPPPVLNPIVPGNIIVRPYDPRAKPVRESAPLPTEYVISPVTNERIPVSKLQEHIKYSLLDPEYLQQRDRNIMDKQNQEMVYAPGSAIGSNLSKLAERRSDIFGSGAEETSIGRKIGDSSGQEKKAPQWDGFTSSSEAVLRAAAKTVSPEERARYEMEMAKHQGLVPDPEKDKIGPQGGIAPSAAPPVIRPPSMPLPPSAAPPMFRPPGMFIPPPVPIPVPFSAPSSAPPVRQPPVSVAPPVPDDDDEDDEPSSKRMKQDSAAEEEYLRTFKGPVTFKVQVPVADKPEWKLQGQMLSLTMDPKESITTLKNRIQDQLGMPAGKQKLQFDGVYVKDTQSLAACNITPGSVVFLQLKERGGRKK